MANYTIYHNPRCSKSRQTLALLEEQGVDVEIIEYLKTPPSRRRLKAILDALDLEPQDIMRKREAEYKEAGLDDASLSRTAQIDAMIAFPKVIERPIVTKGDQAVIGRPPENVLSLIS